MTCVTGNPKLLFLFYKQLSTNINLIAFFTLFNFSLCFYSLCALLPILVLNNSETIVNENRLTFCFPQHRNCLIVTLTLIIRKKKTQTASFFSVATQRATSLCVNKSS